MALESVPLSWELVSAFGTVFATGVGGAWALAQMLSKHRADDLNAKLTEAIQKHTSVSHDLDRTERDKRLLQDELNDTRRLIEALQADLANAKPADLKALQELRHRLQGLDELRHALTGDGDEVWKLRLEQPPALFAQRMAASRTKVLTVINYKGGVGKTTLVAGLAAFLSKRNKRVLIIDFDYQGSLTRTLLLGSRMMLGSMIQADRVIGGSINGREFVELSRDLGATLPGTRFLTCGHTFDGFEFRTMLNWLLGDSKDDVRFRLANLILTEEVQNEFDYVLVDAPPRASTGAINALCASHALLVPTVLDSLSVDATASFLTRASASFRPLNPALEFAGVVGTLTKNTNLSRPEAAALESARNALALWEGRSHLFRNRIRHFTALSEAAGLDLGYLRDANVRRAFDSLGNELLGVLHENEPTPRDAPHGSVDPRPIRGAGESGIAQAL